MNLNLIDEEDFTRTMEEVVLPDLSRCRHEGWMTSHSRSGEGGEILEGGREKDRDPVGLVHFVCYDVNEFHDRAYESGQARWRGAVVISHGFTEFADKYAELTWYFLMQGYSVCLIEHWGHGGSGRGVDGRSLVWVDHWQRYVADLASFCESVGQVYAGDHPLCLYAHSMGGAIAARMLERHPSLIDKAVLSSPMIAPRVGLPPSLVLVAAKAACGLGLGRTMIPGFHPFNPEADMTQYVNGSEARVRWAHRQRAGNPEYQTSAATFGWIRESLAMCRVILEPEQCERVETPILLFQAEPDTMVLPKPQARFVAQVEAGGSQADLVTIHKSMHELFEMPNPVLGPYLQQILDFFDSPYRLGGDR